MLRLGPLILLALAALVAGCGSGGETVTVTEAAPATTTGTTGKAPPATTTTATATTGEEGTPAADRTVTKPTGFTSPTGNIGCYIDRRSVRCDIAERDWKPPPPPAGCDLDYGQGIELRAGAAAELVCAGDTALGGGDQLAYGTSIGAGLLICESEESGMTCRDTETGRGFTISRESYEIF